MARARRAGWWATFIGAVWTVSVAAAHAQPQGKDPDVPVAYRPPPGMCRIWLNGVPPNQQPAPTDCGSAVRNRPANGRVLFGDDYAPRKTGGKTPSNGYASFRARAPQQTPIGVERPTAWQVLPASATLTTRLPHAGRAAPVRAQDEFEAGYAAGYRDAMNGRRPRFRGADRADPGTAVTGPGRAGDVRRSGALGDGGGSGQSGYGQSGYGQGATGGYRTGTGGSAVVVVPSGDDPRYFNNGSYPPPGRANGVCLDRDGDGWCDDPRFGGPVCRDLDGDGRCDDYPELAAAPYPSGLPEMRAGLDIQQGRGSAAALRWLGTSEVVARVVNPQRSGSPYRILWYDANTNALVQTWTDLDGDGIADRVEIFRNGRRVKLLGR